MKHEYGTLKKWNCYGKTEGTPSKSCPSATLSTANHIKPGLGSSLDRPIFSFRLQCATGLSVFHGRLRWYAYAYYWFYSCEYRGFYSELRLSFKGLDSLVNPLYVRLALAFKIVHFAHRVYLYVEWRHSGLLGPIKFREQKSAGKVLALIFCDQDGILLIDYFPKDQTINTEYYSSLLMQLRHFEGKTPAAGRSPRGSCSCTTMPRLTGHLQPGRNWPTWDSSVLITHPILRIWPRRTTTCSLDWKRTI